MLTGIVSLWGRIESSRFGKALALPLPPLVTLGLSVYLSLLLGVVIGLAILYPLAGLLRSAPTQVAYPVFLVGLLGPVAVLSGLALYFNLRAYLRRRSEERARILARFQEIRALQARSQLSQLEGADLPSERTPSVR